MAGSKNDKTEAVLFQAHREKAEVFGKDNDAENSRRQQEERKTNCEMDSSVKEAVGISLQELSRAVEYSTWWTSLFIGLLGIRADSTTCTCFRAACSEFYHIVLSCIISYCHNHSV